MATLDFDRRFEDPPSLSASLAEDHLDFDPERERTPFFGIPSTHSGFRSEADSEPDMESVGPWSPPAWHKAGNGWYRHQLPHSSALRSREASPRRRERSHTGEGDLTVPANIPLPISPFKNTPYSSPDRDMEAPVEASAQPNAAMVETDARSPTPHHAMLNESPNYMRVSVRAELQHRTEPVEAAIKWFSQVFDSRVSFARYVGGIMTAIIICQVLFRAPDPGPMPDIAGVAALAKSYEPLIYYSEYGNQQVGDLQQTGVAVWDLSESVRTSNMTASPVIVGELEQLSEQFDQAASNLIHFFSAVDGDIDSIITTMELSKLELAQVANAPTTSFDRVLGALDRFGLLESSTGQVTRFGSGIAILFGKTTQQRSRAAIQRTFNGILSSVEEAITNQLTYCTFIFGLFSDIDNKLRNLKRTISREIDNQEREEEELLGSLWAKVVGANANTQRKYKKNQALLAAVQNTASRNKNNVLKANTQLENLKSDLDNLRKKLYRQFVNGNSTRELEFEQQIQGLGDTYSYLKKARDEQKPKKYKALYGAGNNIHVNGYESEREIDGS